MAVGEQHPDGLPHAPEQAERVFGDRLTTAERYAELLATTGVTHGLIGPREVPRLWDRHILNCAVVEELVPTDSRVIDVGSGAGLPGLALAIARPDLELVLVEPMLRRTAWLSTAVEELGLVNVRVHRGRAESLWGLESAPVVTARAVARLDELVVWCLPLVRPQGLFLALKGSSARQEIADADALLREYGGVETDVAYAGTAVLTEPTTVVRVRLGVGVQRNSPDTRGRARKVTRGVRRPR